MGVVRLLRGRVAGIGADQPGLVAFLGGHCGGCERGCVDCLHQSMLHCRMKDFGLHPREWLSVSDTTSPWGQAVAQTAADPAPAAPEVTPSRPLYDGRLGELYAIYLRHLVLMLLTLGWSRFWGRTR